MMKVYDRQILEFVENEVDFHRLEMIHGTLYAKLKNDSDCNSLHKKLERFYRKDINPAGAVNMFFVGDEFAFDFVPEDREAPVFSDEEYSGKEGMMPDDIDKGIWSDFAEEGLAEDLPDDVDTLLELENEMKRGK